MMMNMTKTIVGIVNEMTAGFEKQCENGTLHAIAQFRQCQPVNSDFSAHISTVNVDLLKNVTKID